MVAGSRRRGTAQAGVQRRAGRCELLPAASQLDAVVAVPAIGRAAPHRHQPAGTEPAQVVGHGILRLTDQSGQLPHPPVAAGQLGQQAPAQWITR